jgi:hypothetical protein
MFTLIFYGENSDAAERLADDERKNKRRAGVRDARVFRGEPEKVDAVVVLPCVAGSDRERVAAAYGDKVSPLLEWGSTIPIAAGDVRVAGRYIDVTSEVEQSTYRAVHRGRGSYSVMRGEDEIVEGLTRLEYQSFNTYSPAEQAAFVANRAKG